MDNQQRTERAGAVGVKGAPTHHAVVVLVRGAPLGRVGTEPEADGGLQILVEESSRSRGSGLFKSVGEAMHLRGGGEPPVGVETVFAGIQKPSRDEKYLERVKHSFGRNPHSREGAQLLQYALD